MANERSRRDPDQRLNACLRDTLSFVGVLWLVEAADYLCRYAAGITLDGFGIVPRRVHGLVGVVVAPFLHGSWGHLIANSVALIMLGTVALRFSRLLTGEALVSALLVSGLLTWVIAPAGTIHLGASGLVFGLLGFIIGNGLFRRSFGTFVLAVVIGFLYSGAIMGGVLPSDANQSRSISWQMHLGGFLGGLVAAWHLRRVAAR